MIPQRNFICSLKGSLKGVPVKVSIGVPLAELFSFEGFYEGLVWVCLTGFYESLGFRVFP